MNFDIIKEDFKNNSFRSFLILFFYRIMNYSYNKKWTFLVFIINFIYFFIKVLLQINTQISYKAKIGRNIKLPHIGFGVVISSKAKIGNSVTIFHLVTIGINENKCDKKEAVCVEIGNNCLLGAGSKIISCKVGDGCKIGTNVSVFKDIPDNSIVVNRIEIK